MACGSRTAPSLAPPEYDNAASMSRSERALALSLFLILVLLNKKLRENFKPYYLMRFYPDLDGCLVILNKHAPASLSVLTHCGIV